jgi:hypothetical protein
MLVGVTTRYRLKLTELKFISPVDKPAQETATALLIKRATGETRGAARVVKLDESLGLVFCWAFTSKAAGADYYDLHDDNIVEDDMIKVCADFMSGARAVDEMHDGVATGQVVFGMPMTAEVAKAFGVETETEGFMVAIKPAADVFEKFKSGEYTGVSIEGTGVREPVAMRKRAALTTASLGHTHLIYCLDEMQSGSTSTESVEGASDYGSYHSHPWVRADDGSIVLGKMHGHTHSVAEIAAAIGKSTPSAAARSVGLTMTTHEQQIADLSARTASLSKALAVALTLQPEHLAHAATLGDDAQAFLAKSAGEREAIVKAASDADPVVFKGEVTGVEVRRSHGQLARKLAEQNEANAATIAKQEAALSKAEATAEATEIASIAKRRLPSLPGSDDVHAYIVKAIRKGGGDAAMIENAMKALEGASVAVAKSSKAPGANEERDAEETSKRGELRTAVEAFAKANNIQQYEAAFVKAIKVDPASRALYEEVRAAG